MLPAQVWCHYAEQDRPGMIESGHPGNHPPDPSRFNRIINDHDRKPFGGLWTSSFEPIGLCDWVEFAGANMEHTWFKAWILRPEPDARLFEIGSYEDLERMIEQYPWPCSCVLCQRMDMYTDGMYPGPMSLTTRHPWDVEAMAADGWDGIHLTHAGRRTTWMAPPERVSGRDGFYYGQIVNLYGWDCECTLWFRWRFADVRYYGYWRYEDRQAEKIEAVLRQLEAAGVDSDVLAKFRASIAEETA